MRKIINIPISEATPSIESILEVQGVPPSVNPDIRIMELALHAIEIFKEKAFPTGIIMEISKEEFEDIFTGEGKNDFDSPVKSIYLSSDDLALFAVTMEEDVCSEITRLFQVNDFALGSMLDSTASEGTEMCAQVIENFYRQHLSKIGRYNPQKGILRFSPGYCGWHISSQRKLFKHLKPEDIGITLNNSYLMQPIKSISGVIISGKKEIFKFEDTFSFCSNCSTHTCQDRIRFIHENN